MTMLQLYEDFGLDENTQSFTGHAMALQRDDSYLHKYDASQSRLFSFSSLPPQHDEPTVVGFCFFPAVCFGFVVPYMRGA